MLIILLNQKIEEIIMKLYNNIINHPLNLNIIFNFLIDLIFKQLIQNLKFNY